MKRYILPLLYICLLASGCSKSSEDEPTYLELNSLLCPYFSNAETRSVSNEALDTLFIGNSYNVNLYPCSKEENNGYISSVCYYLNGSPIKETNSYPFTSLYTPNLEPGKYTLSVAPVFTNEYLIWKTKTSAIVIAEKKVEEPDPQTIPVTGISIRLSDHSDAFQFLRKNILLGNRLIIEPVISPANATNQEATLTSSNSEVASIEEANNQKNIITNSVGFTEITATSLEGNYTAICELSVCDIDTFTGLSLAVGTEGNSITGFYSYVLARFDLNAVTTIPLKIAELQIMNDQGEVMLTENNIEFRYGQDNYKSVKLITSQGLQTFPASGWKAIAKYSWNNKDYSIEYIKP